MKIPEVRKELEALAVMHDLPRLAELAEQLKRRSRAVKAPPVSAKVTRPLAKDVRAFKADNPNLTQFEVARHFGINQGRVSEILHGKRN